MRIAPLVLCASAWLGLSARAHPASACDAATAASEGSRLRGLAEVEEKGQLREEATKHYKLALERLKEAYACEPTPATLHQIAIIHLALREPTIAKADFLNAAAMAKERGDVATAKRIELTLASLDTNYGNVLLEWDEFFGGEAIELVTVSIGGTEVPAQLLKQPIPVPDGEHVVAVRALRHRFLTKVIAMPQPQPIRLKVVMLPPQPAGSPCLEHAQCRSQLCYQSCALRRKPPAWAAVGWAMAALGGASSLSSGAIFATYGISGALGHERPDLIVPGWVTLGIGFPVFMAGAIMGLAGDQVQVDEPP